MGNHSKIEFQAGEYEILKTKAECGWWDSGKLLLTNFRLLWSPNRFSATLRVVINLQDIADCDQVRSPKYLFLQPSLRITLRDGTRHELHDMKEIDHVQRLILQNLTPQRYELGALFRE